MEGQFPNVGRVEYEEPERYACEIAGYYQKSSTKRKLQPSSTYRLTYVSMKNGIELMYKARRIVTRIIVLNIKQR